MSLFLQKKYPLQQGATNPILRTRAEEVETISPEVQAFCRDLVQLMRLYKGVGLAAPQVGRSQRILVATQRKQLKKHLKCIGEIVMINPQIIEKSKEMIISLEGCLSLPGIHGHVLRHKEITVTYQDIAGNMHIKKFCNFDAIIIQHEIDHLDGILFIDKLISSETDKQKKSTALYA